ncbi:hypothetical protein Poly59_06140 [Rubripirellula reticaptiva]|uniref:Uncharacterized protein n=1 Tax=Rubripirellula reticaptiva TaxID=2528013 RepID=A0A5C6FC95_9BACT|nr:hypothetical protein Poly59_06140 [Rubripirellula reticaptiva]
MIANPSSKTRNTSTRRGVWSGLRDCRTAILHFSFDLFKGLNDIRRRFDCHFPSMLNKLPVLPPKRD